jgi:class 3 adenylate cyclase/TolB-like protein
MSETRKIAAILCSDVVGYSRLAGADEDRILARMRALRSDLIDPTIAVHHGRIVKRTGDGSLIEFRSVVDAVRCAVEVQNAMIERNAGVPEDRRILFRIGIHLGDVVEEADGDLMGDGVNIAARLEGIAAPGAICLSEDAYRQVKGRLDLAVTDLGPTQLKNIAEPIRAYSLLVGVPAQPKPAPAAEPATPTKPPPPKKRSAALAAALAALLLVIAAGAWRLLETKGPAVVAADAPAEAARLSIVVLPFDNLSGDPEQDYFADGITDDLTTDLSHLPDGFVIARNTAFTFKGKPIDVKQLGRELGVRYALEGSVQRLNEKITVNAQLISTETGAHVWADRFDGERDRLGDLQVEFVARLANSLGVELVKAESLRAMRLRPNNPDAVDFYMRGRTAFGRGFAVDNVTEAGEDFERALQLDPGLTRAQVALARTLFDRVIRFHVADPADLDRADSLITKALSVDPNDAEAHFVKGEILTYVKKQFAEALAELKVAIEDDRNFAAAYAQYGATHWFIGQAAEVIPNVETALRLSPRDPLRNIWELFICHAHMHLAEWEPAAEWCEKSLATRATFWQAYLDLISAEGWLGHDAEAKAAIAELLKLRPGFTVQTWASVKQSDDPTFNREFGRIIEGLRKAGLPEQ